MSSYKADWKSDRGLTTAVARETGMFSGIAETTGLFCPAVTILPYLACFLNPAVYRTAYSKNQATPCDRTIRFYAQILTGKFILIFIRLFNYIQIRGVAFLRKRPENKDNQVKARRL